jgi:Tol biopolymer transport system component
MVARNQILRFYFIVLLICSSQNYIFAGHSKIAFTSDRDGDWEIYTMNVYYDIPEPGNIVVDDPENLTQDPGYDHAPSWSPDGNEIVFQSERHGNSEIYITNTDVSNLNVRRITDNNYGDHTPCWSPLGDEILFNTNRVDNYGSVYIMDLDGGNQRLIRDTLGYDSNPWWSPDGQWIAWAPSNGDRDIYLMEKDGDNPVPIFSEPSDDTGPEFSPDGKDIAFTTSSGNNEIYRINIETKVYINLTKDPAADDRYPTWSPDGELIAFCSKREPHSDHFEIYIMNADGTNPTRITYDTAFNGWPKWSPFLDLSPATIYVDRDAPGANDGSSWADAFNYLYDALAVASSGDHILVAQGIYQPNTSGLAGPREASFQLKNGVAVQGGYAGYGEPNPDDRDIELYETILIGDLNGDDAEIINLEDLLSDSSRDDNCYHVITGSGTDVTAVLDGFTITAGNANETTDPDNRGGGIYNDNGSPTIINCTIYLNSSNSSGGGMNNKNYSNPTMTKCTFKENYSGHCGGMGNQGHSSPTVTNTNFIENLVADAGGGIGNGDECNPKINNCLFLGNSAGRAGGIYNLDDSNPLIINCIFSNNKVTNDGGGIQNLDNSSPTITNCTFCTNSADINGGGIHNKNNSNPNITNCILWGNSDGGGSDESAQIYNEESSAVVAYSCIQGLNYYAGNENIGNDPRFNDPDGPDNDPNTWEDNDYHLRIDSPCINAGDPVGDYANQTDIDNEPRVQKGRVDIGADECAFDHLVPYRRLEIWKDYYNEADTTGFVNKDWWQNTSMALVQLAIDAVRNDFSDLLDAIGSIEFPGFGSMAAGYSICTFTLGFGAILQAAEYSYVSNCIWQGYIDSSMAIPNNILALQQAIYSEIDAANNHDNQAWQNARTTQIEILNDMLEQNNGNVISSFGAGAVNYANDPIYNLPANPRAIITYLVRSLYSLARTDLCYLLDGQLRPVRQHVDSYITSDINNITCGTNKDELAGSRGSLFVSRTENNQIHIERLTRKYPWMGVWTRSQVSDGIFPFARPVRLAVGNVEGVRDDKLYAAVQDPQYTETHIYSYDFDDYGQNESRVLFTSIDASLASTCPEMLVGDASNNGLDAIYIATADCSVKEVWYNPFPISVPPFLPGLYQVSIDVPNHSGADVVTSLTIGDVDPGDGFHQNELVAGTIDGYVYLFRCCGYYCWNRSDLTPTPLTTIKAISINHGAEDRLTRLHGVFVLTHSELYHIEPLYDPPGAWATNLISNQINAGQALLITNGALFVSSQDGLMIVEPEGQSEWKTTHLGPYNYEHLITRPSSRKQDDNSIVNMDPSFIDGFYGFTATGRIENIKMFPSDGIIYVAEGASSPYCGTLHNPFRRIQDAIYSSYDGDEIRVQPGTYLENIDFVGKNLSILSRNPDTDNIDPDNTIIDGGAQGSVISCISNQKTYLTLRGFTITNGSNITGGGVLCKNSDLNVSDCFIMGNQANEYGAGMFFQSCNPDITNTVISGNVCTGYGGGICSLSANTRISNSVILDNSADTGGGFALLFTEDSFITNCTFLNNTATRYGGALLSAYETNTYITNSIIWGNSAEYGPQLCLLNADFPINIVTLSHSDVQGGPHDVYVGYGCNLDWRSGNIELDPQFIPGKYNLHRYSPCINMGETLSEHISQKDIDGQKRLSYGATDIGADEVYPVAGDFEPDEDVDVSDLIMFTSYYLNTSCNSANNWCIGTDINKNSRVDLTDFSYFAVNWLIYEKP